MKAIIRLLALLAVAGPLSAQEPLASRVVVLDNENLLEGDVARVDEGWRVRQPVGGEIVLPPKRVLAVVADRPAAFRVVAAKANLRDADERLRLAKWCHLHGLADEAKRQAETAIAMRPDYPAARQFLTALPANKPAPPVIVPVKAEAPAKPIAVADVPTVDYNSASFPLFASRIHAILQNTCANCHARDDVKAFKLVRQTGRPAVSRNLAIALPYIDLADPAKSSLLIKAVTPHGTAAEAPLKTRNHPAYLALEAWVMIARAPEGTTDPEPRPETPEPKRLPALDKETALLPAPTPGGFGAARPAGSDDKKPAGPPDPFDPATFNKSLPAKD